MIRHLCLVFLMLTITSVSLAADDSKVIAVQQAKITDLERQVSDLQDTIQSLEKSIAKNNKAISSNNQSISSVAGKFGGVFFRKYWNRNGSYSSCDNHCAAQGLRCVTGQGNTTAQSKAIACNQPTNVCLCAAF
jgi:TolA-binding protein